MTKKEFKYKDIYICGNFKVFLLGKCLPELSPIILPPNPIKTQESKTRMLALLCLCECGQKGTPYRINVIVTNDQSEYLDYSIDKILCRDCYLKNHSEPISS